MIKILKYFIVFLFLLSATAKLINFNSTVNFYISNTGISYNITKTSIVIVILTELFIAVTIFTDLICVKNVFLFITITIILFTLSNIVFLILGLDNCGCFGTILKIGPVESIGKNILLIILLIILRKKMLKKQN